MHKLRKHEKKIRSIKEILNFITKAFFSFLFLGYKGDEFFEW